MFIKRMIGYKAFLISNGKLVTKYGDRSKHYKLDETYEYDGPLALGLLGFHFCENIQDVYKYYPYRAIVVKIKIPKDAEVFNGDDKCCTNKMKLIEYIDGQYKDDEVTLHYQNGQLHCKYKPAYVEYYSDGNPKIHKWFLFGEQHRIDGRTSYYEYYHNRKIKHQEWWQFGICCRDNDKPSKVSYYPSGSVQSKQWWRNGRLHRENDLPAYIEYYDNGRVKYMQWWCFGVLHRNNNPMENSVYYEKTSMLFVRI